MKKFTKKQKKILDGLWEDVEAAQARYWDSVRFIESQAKHVLEIEIEVFHADGEAVGFGDYERKYELYDKQTCA